MIPSAVSVAPAPDPAAPPAPAGGVRVLRGTVVVTRRVHFNAAHRLDNPGFDADWNQRTYGICNNANWHGHNYVLEVSVRGEPDPQTGYVVDLGVLKRVLEDAVARPCDHRNLNVEVPFLRGVIPSTENLVIAFWHEIAPRLPAGTLHRVRLYESERNFAEFLGPDAAA